MSSYFQYIFTRSKEENFMCNRCGCQLPNMTSFYKNRETGEILCKNCFDWKVRNNEISTDRVYYVNSKMVKSKMSKK